MAKAIEAGGRVIVTWLTPYLDAWERDVGAIAPGRLAKSLAPARELLGDEQCLAAFFAYCGAKADKKDPAWFAKDCRRWVEKATAHEEPLVSETGVLTSYGRRVYEGQR